MDKIKRIKELTASLNEYRDAYYNNSKSKISDYEYDSLFDELQTLENETGFILNNSPTHSVGYEIKSKLQKVKHSHPMLSLDKTKSVDDILAFLGGRSGIVMLKMDGLTMSVAYRDGKLYSGETRGNGQIGEDVLHNAKTIKNLPKQIVNGNLVVDGEVIITKDDFDKINEKLLDNEKYKNPRNLASGSIRQLDNKVAAKRNMRFIAWKSIEGIESNSFSERLSVLERLGFEVVPYKKLPSEITREELENIIGEMKEIAENKGFPIDGLVFGYDEVAYGESLGATSRFLRSQTAYKFYDEETVTTLRNIEWSLGKTGQLTPVAIFDPVELDGTSVERASLHNITICKELKLGIGDEITVYKSNMIIPQIRENLSKSNTFEIPKVCSVCGYPTAIQKDNDTEILVCTNEICSGKLLRRVSHFVSKKGMDIDGLSKATLEKFVSLGWIKCLFDVYNLGCHYGELINMEGFGTRTVEKLDKSIEKSKDVELKNFIAALSIPNIGTSQSKELAKTFATWEDFASAGFGDYNFTRLDGFGDVLNNNIHHWFHKMWNEDRVGQLVRNLHITNNAIGEQTINGAITGKVFVITGFLEHFRNRKELQELIEKNGGKITGSVTSKTDFLINNDTTSGSSKNKKAKELGVPIITEEEFVSLTY